LRDSGYGGTKMNGSRRRVFWICQVKLGIDGSSIYSLNDSAAFAWVLNRINCVSVSTRYSFFLLNIVLLVCTSPWWSTLRAGSDEDPPPVDQLFDNERVEVADSGSSVSSDSRRPLKEPNMELLRFPLPRDNGGREKDEGLSGPGLASRSVLVPDAVETLVMKEAVRRLRSRFAGSSSSFLELNCPASAPRELRPKKLRRLLSLASGAMPRHDCGCAAPREAQQRSCRMRRRTRTVDMEMGEPAAGRDQRR
jgi:hypothetical protein